MYELCTSSLVSKVRPALICRARGFGGSLPTQGVSKWGTAAACPRPNAVHQTSRTITRRTVTRGSRGVHRSQPSRWPHRRSRAASRARSRPCSTTSRRVSQWGCSRSCRRPSPRRLPSRNGAGRRPAGWHGSGRGDHDHTVVELHRGRDAQPAERGRLRRRDDHAQCAGDQPRRSASTTSTRPGRRSVRVGRRGLGPDARASPYREGHQRDRHRHGRRRRSATTCSGTRRSTPVSTTSTSSGPVRSRR